MRVIAGSARRMKLLAPPGKDIRPTQDIIKETLFNMLQNEVPGSVFLDLCAGSGAIGIEALSRGAKKAYFAESEREPLRCLQENLERTHLADRAQVLRCDVLTALRRIREEEADIIYLDPPYDAKLYRPVLAVLGEMPYVKEHTVIIAECALREDFSFAGSLSFVITKEKCYKHNKHVFLHRG